MKANSKPGVTLLEMTIVILVLLVLMSTGMVITTQYKKWQLGRTASETLRNVYSAQRLYLSDNPTVSVADITAADLIPYLTNRETAIPTVVSLTGTQLTIKVNVSPPVINDGSDGTYDPSGQPLDSLWDVGQ